MMAANILVSSILSNTERNILVHRVHHDNVLPNLKASLCGYSTSQWYSSGDLLAGIPCISREELDYQTRKKKVQQYL